MSKKIKVKMKVKTLNIKLCIHLLDNGYSLELTFNTINRRLKKLFVTKSVKAMLAASVLPAETQ